MADLNNTIVRGKLRVTEDINTNGNIAGSSITGNGSGLTNLNASNISSGTLSADRLATSGATAGSYGPSANATPAYGATFNVPYITVDNKGRVTAASTKTVKIPASDNKDTHYTNYLQIKGNGTEAVKFTQDSNKTLNLNPSGSVSISASAASGEITISAADTKNTAGATNDTVSKLYLIGAKEQTDNPLTFSNSNVYIENSELFADSLSAGYIDSFVNRKIKIRVWDTNIPGLKDVGYFGLDKAGTMISLNGHLVTCGTDDSDHPFKPANQTNIEDIAAGYFNTGIALRSGGKGITYKLSFPGKSGTLATLDDTKLEIVDLTGIK